MLFIFILIEIFFLYQFLRYFYESNILLKPNYRENVIPASMGIIYGLVVSFYTFLYEIFTNDERYYIFSFAILFIAFIGLIDDIFGDNKSKGFRGHLKRLWLYKYFSTGFLKMIIIPTFLLLMNYYLTHKLAISFFYTILSALSINLFNLLDLRPGRCIKFLFIFSALCMPFIKWDFFSISSIFLLIPIFIGDLREIYMLGDSGSNLVGYIFALIITNKFCKETNFNFLILITVVFLTLNLLSESVSFSKLIEKNKILRFIDMLGRKN